MKKKNKKKKNKKKKNKKKKINRRLISVWTKITKGLLVVAAIIIVVLSCICISRNRSTDDPLENLDSRIMAELAKNGIDFSHHKWENRSDYYYKIDEKYSSVFGVYVSDKFKDDDLRTDYQPMFDAIKYVDNITEIYIYSGEDNYCNKKSWNDARVIFYMEFKANGHECRVINIKEVIGIEDGCLNWQNRTYYYSGEIPISLESVHDFSYDHERPLFYYQKDDYGNEISFDGELSIDGEYEINGFIDNNKLYILIEPMGVEFRDNEIYEIEIMIRLNDEENYEAQFFREKIACDRDNLIRFEDFNDDGYADFEIVSNGNGDGIRFYWSHDGQCYERE